MVSRRNRKSCAIVFTRARYAVACFTLYHNGHNTYVLFDANPPFHHPKRAAYRFCVNQEDAAEYLDGLFHDDSSLAQGSGNGTGIVTGNFFVCSSTDMSMSKAACCALVKASVAILNGKVEQGKVEAQRQHIASEYEHFVREFARQMQRRNRNGRDDSDPLLSTNKGKQRARSPSPYSPSDTLVSGSGSHDGHRAYNQLPIDPRILIGMSTVEVLQNLRRGGGVYKQSFNRVLRSIIDGDGTLHVHEDHQVLDMSESDEFETFDCGICFDEHPIENRICVDVCGHTYCHTCSLGYAKSKIKEHRFPIVCPTCSAEGNGPHLGSKYPIDLFNRGIFDANLPSASLFGKSH